MPLKEYLYWISMESETSLRYLNWISNESKISLKKFILNLKWMWNESETNLKRIWNESETNLKRIWNEYETSILNLNLEWMCNECLLNLNLNLNLVLTFVWRRSRWKSASRFTTTKRSGITEKGGWVWTWN